MADFDNQYLDSGGLRYFWSKIVNLFVQKDGNKVLSDNNFTTAEKNKLANLQNYALPEATVETLGGIRVGYGLSTDENGRLSVVENNWGQITGTPTTLVGYGITDAASTSQYNTLSSQVSDQGKLDLLLAEAVPGTTTRIQYAQDGNIQSITHAQGATNIRTDRFTFADNIITESRTLSTGENLTIVTNTETLVTTTTYTGV